MKALTQVTSLVLLITSILAAPLTSQRRALHDNQRVSRVLPGRGTSRPFKPGTAEILYPQTSPHETYSSNWAGAVLIGTGYTSVSGGIVVPVAKPPRGANDLTSYCASAWVGIDGDTCDTAILQTGIDLCIQGGVTSYSAWYEWYPDYSHDFSDIQISAGDVVKFSVDATSKSSGSAFIQNLSTNTSVTHQFPRGLGGDLCEFNAEWIVEDFSINTGLTPFANFGTVEFSNAIASAGGQTFGPFGATIMDIYQGHVLTSSSVTNSSVTISYL